MGNFLTKSPISFIFRIRKSTTWAYKIPCFPFDLVKLPNYSFPIIYYLAIFSVFPAEGKPCFRRENQQGTHSNCIFKFPVFSLSYRISCANLRNYNHNSVCYFRSRRISRDNLPPMSDEGHLISELLSRYRSHKTLARPVINSNSTVFVQFGLSLIQILDLDEKNQMLTTLVWKEYVSLDFGLK